MPTQSGLPKPVAHCPRLLKPDPVDARTVMPWLFHTSYQSRSALPSPVTSPHPAQSGMPNPCTQIPCGAKPAPVEVATVTFPTPPAYSYQSRSSIPSPLTSQLAAQSGCAQPVIHWPRMAKLLPVELATVTPWLFHCSYQ